MRRLVILVMFVLSILSCKFEDLFTSKWTTSGTATFNGTPSNSVKMAAFYTDGDSYLDSMQYPEAADPVQVSSVADLGTEGGPFSLTVDATSIDPAAGDSIYLIMWIDVDGNGAHGTTEDWSYVQAYYGCPVFKDSPICEYYFDEDYNPFMGTEPGWNQSIGLAVFEPIDSAVKDGARIENYSYWW